MNLTAIWRELAPYFKLKKEQCFICHERIWKYNEIS